MADIARDVEVNLGALRTSYSKFDILNENLKIEISEDGAILVGTSLDNLKRYPNWYLIGNKKFFFKERKGVRALVSELLGEDLSKYVGIDTIQYKIVQDKAGNIKGLLSEDVKDHGALYTRSCYLGKKDLQEVKRILLDKTYECDEDLRRKLTLYLVRNFYAALKDRTANSFLAKKNGQIILPAIIDYESSYIESDMMTYVDPLINFTFHPESIQYIRDNNDYYQEYVDLVLSYSYDEALRRVEDTHQISIPSDVKEYYLGFENERNEFLSHIGFSK